LVHGGLAGRVAEDAAVDAKEREVKNKHHPHQPANVAYEIDYKQS